MKVTNVSVQAIDMPLVQAGWEFARGKVPTGQVDVVAIETDEGLTGYGAAPTGAPMISGETHATVADVISRHIAPRLVGRDPRDIGPLMREVSDVVDGNRRAKAGVDIALHDIAAKAAGLPLFQYLGGSFRESIPVLRLVGMKAPEKMADDVAGLQEQGFRSFKLKVGSDPSLDVDRVAAVQAILLQGGHITVDVNQAYDPKTAIKVIRALEDVGIDLVEQPVHYADIEGLAFVRRNVNTPIEADESVRSAEEALRVIRAEAADFISIKIGKLGGIREAIKVAHLCATANVRCLVGTNPAGQLIDAANAHFVASQPHIDHACEVGEFARMSGDPCSGLVTENGRLLVPQGVGLGVTVTPVAAA